MALLWKPNNAGESCGCVLEAPSGGVLADPLTPHTFVKQCAEHMSMSAEQVIRENLRASRVMNRLLALAPDAHVDASPDGRQWRAGSEPTRSFDGARVMQVRLRAWPSDRRLAAQQAVDADVGAGRTRVT